MANILAWSLLVLGIGHIFYGLIKFRGPVTEAIAEGYINKFKTPEIRRSAFWFLNYGPLLMLAGSTAIHAVAHGDLPLLRLIGFYLLASSLIGLAALPKSPFLVGVALSSLLVAAGYGML